MCLIVLLSLLLTGCPVSTEQQLKIAYDSYTGIVTSAAILCEKGLLEQPTCNDIAHKASLAITALDTARAIVRSNKPAVDGRDAKYYLKLGLDLLREAKKQLPATTAAPIFNGGLSWQLA